MNELQDILESGQCPECKRLTTRADDLQYANDFSGKSIKRLQARNEVLERVLDAAKEYSNPASVNSGIASRQWLLDAIHEASRIAMRGDFA